MQLFHDTILAFEQGTVEGQVITYLWNCCGNIADNLAFSSKKSCVCHMALLKTSGSLKNFMEYKAEIPDAFMMYCLCTSRVQVNQSYLKPNYT